MLEKFFNPDSIAIIGASRDEHKIGYGVLKNLIAAQFKGKIYPVNPNAEEILGHKCYAGIKDLPKGVSLAIFAIPAQFVLDAVRECGENDIKNIIMITAGFRESGSNGMKLEKELIDMAKRYDIRILGPNCLGMLNSVDNVNASFANSMIQKGDIAFISQSGAICSAMLDWAEKEHIGFSKFISLGNMAILNEVDFLEYFIDDKNTKAVFAYLENFSDGKRFIEVSKKLCSKKPLVMIKSGTSERGKAMAMSHTGAIAEDKEVIKGVLKQVNAIHSQSLEGMFDLVKLIANLNIPSSNNIAVIGNAGGVNVIMADKISESPLNLINFEQETRNKLQAGLPAIVHNITNPLDIIGDADAERYNTAIENILRDKTIENILVMLTLQSVTEPFQTAKNIVRLVKRYKKNVITSFIGGSNIQKAVKHLNEHNIANFSYPENAIDALSKISVWKENSQKELEKNNIDVFSLENDASDKIVQALQNKEGMLDFNEIKNIFDALKLPFVESFFCSELKELSSFTQKIGYPVVMKAITSSIVHKTDAGAVKLGIISPQEMAKAYDQLIKLGGKYKTKILVQPMINNAIELIIGAKRDNKFGPVILFGLGGIYTELLKDFSLRISPLNIEDAMSMIGEIKTAGILEGARGKKSVDKNELAQVILKISHLIYNFPKIKEIDLNPVMIKEGHIYIVDAKIIVE